MHAWTYDRQLKGLNCKERRPQKMMTKKRQCLIVSSLNELGYALTSTQKNVSQVQLCIFNLVFLTARVSKSLLNDFVGHHPNMMHASRYSSSSGNLFIRSFFLSELLGWLVGWLLYLFFLLLKGVEKKKKVKKLG